MALTRVRFELFPDKTAGSNLIWGAEYNVASVAGQFNVILGAAGGTPVPGAAVNDISFAFGSAERYLQMTILTNGTTWTEPQVLLPRQQILSTPFAFAAAQATAATTAETSQFAQVAQLANSLEPTYLAGSLFRTIPPRSWVPLPSIRYSPTAVTGLRRQTYWLHLSC